MSDVDLRTKALDLIDRGASVWQAAQAVGVSRTVVSEWLLSTRRPCGAPKANGGSCRIETLGGRLCHWHGGDRG